MTSPHGGDCNGSWCSYRGCCEHGEPEDGIGCRASDAPDGMRCTNAYCGCEGAMGYNKPTQPPEATDEPEDDRPRQLHQETSLFDIDSAVLA